MVVELVSFTRVQKKRKKGDLQSRRLAFFRLPFLRSIIFLPSLAVHILSFKEILDLEPPLLHKTLTPSRPFLSFIIFIFIVY